MVKWLNWPRKTDLMIPGPEVLLQAMIVKSRRHMQVGNLQGLPCVCIALHKTLLYLLSHLILAVSHGGLDSMYGYSHFHGCGK